MNGRAKETDQLLSLHDVREYLIDTNALKEAEALLISDVPIEDNDRDAAYTESKTKALGTAASGREGRLAYMRKRTQKNKVDRREEILDNLVGTGPQGKLNALREEEEMKELLAVESALREESILLEKERMSVAAQAESAKRSNLQKMESQIEQEMLQLELQRNNANKELDKKMSALETLTSEIQKVELEMDSQFGPQAMKEREEKKNEKENSGDSKKSHMDQMFELVKSHANAVVGSQGLKAEAEDELSRLTASQSTLNERSTSRVELGSIINMKSILANSSSNKNLDKAIPEDLIRELKASKILGQEAKGAVDTLATMGSTLALEGQQARLETLKVQAQKELELYKDPLITDDASVSVLPNANDNEESTNSQGGGLFNRNLSMQDSLDAWLSDNQTSENISEASSEAKDGETLLPGPRETYSRAQSLEPSALTSASTKSSAKVNPSTETPSTGLEVNGALRNSSASIKPGSEQEDISGGNHAPRDSLTEDLINEIKRLKEEKEEREMKMNEQLKKQQMQFQQQLHQIQSQAQNPVTPSPGMGGYPHPQMDPYMQQFMMQMQMMNQQIERENQMMMQQLNSGGGEPFNAMNPSGQRGPAAGPGAAGAPAGLYGNPLRRSGGNVFGSDYEAGMQAFHERAARDGMDDGELRIPLHRKQMHKVELKYSDEIRVLNLEMEKARKQVELDEFRYEAEKNREARRQEDEHAAWLEEQKKELQTLKMKQALAKEQRLLNMQLGQLGQPAVVQTGESAVTEDHMGGSEQGYRGNDMVTMEEAGVGALPIPVDLAGGVNALVDGLCLPDPSKIDSVPGSILESITDSSMFRVVVGIYDAAGTCISRLAQSNWQCFKASTVGLQHTLPDVEDGDAIVVKSGLPGGKKDGKKITGNDAADWLLLPVKRTMKKSEHALSPDLRLLVEIQFSNNAESISEPSSLGWGTFPLLGTEIGPGGRGLPPNGQSDPGDLFLRNGFWRVYIRKGLSEVAADPRALPGQNGEYTAASDLAYYTDAFILLRIGDSMDMQRQYAWNPADHPGVLGDRKAVLRLYKNLFPGMEDSRNTSEASLPQDLRQDTREETSGGNRSRPSSSVSKADAKPAAAGSDSGNLQAVPEESEEEEAAVLEANAYEKKRDTLVEAKATVPWLMGVEPGAATEKYQRGDGVDVYIDGCMYLPDNTTVSRVKISFFTSEKEPCGPVSECFSSLDDVAISPNYGHKVELRGSSLNLTTTCLLRFDTVDSATLRPATIGYSCFKVFCTREREQPESTNSPNVYINTGLYQLPVYGGKVGKLEVFTEHMLDNNPKIPCASVLVRIKAAPHSKDGFSVLSQEDVPEDQWQVLGLSSPAPEYMTGAYYGKLCEPSDLEALCYTAKSSSLNVTVDSTLNRLLSAASDGDVANAATFPQRPEVIGKQDAKEQKVISDWVKSLLPPHKEMKRVLPYQYIAPYSLDCGLNVSIDMLYNMPEASSGFFSTAPTTMYKVIYSIVPPGLFYKEPPMSEGVFYTKGEDTSRCYRAPTFTDGFVHLYPPILDNSTYLLVEVRTVTIQGAKGGPGAEPVVTVERSSLDTSYWTLLPISSEASPWGEPKYVASGIYQLPLIKGAPPAVDLFSSESKEPLDLVLERLGPKGKASTQGKRSLGKALKLADGASVIVRVCNPIFKHVLDFPRNEPHDISPAEIQTQILDAAVNVASKGVSGTSASKSNFKYISERYANPTTKYPSVKERLAALNIVDLKKFSKNVNKTFANEVNINMD